MMSRCRLWVLTLAVIAVAGAVAACESAAPSTSGAGAARRTALTDLQAAAASARSSTINTTAAPFPVTMDPARRLIFFKRAVGGDPTASQLTIDTDGHAAALVTDGGIEGEKKHFFILSPRRIAQLRRLIARAGLRDTDCCDVRYWIYWVALGHRGYRLAEKRVPASARPLIGALDALIDAHTQY